jgi:hypothetical protein
VTVLFDREQRGILRGMTLAALVTAAAFAGACFWPVVAGSEVPGGERLAYAVRCDVFVLIWLLAAVARVARTRFVSPEDIAGAGLSEATPPVSRSQAILQNTLEQTLLALPVHLSLATLLPRAWLGLIPMLVVLFGIGRSAFWRNYQYGAARRAFGFGLTFYPTVAAYALSIVLIIRVVVR